MAVTVAFQSSSGNPYTIMDLGVDVGSSAQGIEWLKSIDGNPVLEGSISPPASAGDGTVYKEVPSPFKDSLAVVNSTAAFVSDFGFTMGFGGFDAAQSRYDPGTSGITVGSYVRAGRPIRGALALSLNPGGEDVSCTVVTSDFQTGRYVESKGSGLYEFYAFFDKNGGCYFFFVINVNGALGKLALIDPGSLRLNFLGTLQPLRKYYLTDSPYQIKGNVTDAANMPAPGRVVTAYNRETLVPVGNAVTGADGSYQMGLAVKSGASVFVVCLDDDAPPNFEAQVVDRVAII